MLSTRMPDKPIAILLEVVQFIPIIGFAFPFLVAGEVDVTTAAMPFMVTALLAVLITTGVAIMRAPVNPILLGSGLWLLLGAIGFGGGIAPLANALAALQGASLLACISTVAIAYAAFAQRGYVGVDHPDVRRWSWLLVLLTLGLLTWAYVMRSDIRLGGGLPFIAVNILRRGVGLALLRRSRTAA